jgi:hypothetical protein
MLSAQLIVVVGTLLITLLTIPLAAYLTLNYLKKKQTPHLYFSLGLWAFAVAAFEEVLFAFNIYSQFLINSYLFLVAMVVLLLSLGSVMLLKSEWIKKYYAIFAVAATIILLAALAATYEGNLLEYYVVWILPSIPVIVASSIITYPASAALILTSIKGYLKTRSVKPLFIIAGVIEIAVCGTLYIVSFPLFLYISEFFGIILLWLGVA